MKTLRVLLVEDNQGDVLLIEEALRAHNLQFKLDVVADGIDVKRYLERIGTIPDAPCPDVFLLDLNLPKGDGHEILNNFRGNPKCSAAPVIIITSSDAPKDRQRAERLGASAYFRKPSDLAEFMELGAIIRGVIDLPAQ